jgi:hypothetical protein
LPAVFVAWLALIERASDAPLPPHFRSSAPRKPGKERAAPDSNSGDAAANGLLVSSTGAFPGSESETATRTRAPTSANHARTSSMSGANAEVIVSREAIVAGFNLGK